MNYEKLLELAREKAIARASQMYPPSLRRDEECRKLVVRYYLEYISPVVVDEAQ